MDLAQIYYYINQYNLDSGQEVLEAAAKLQIAADMGLISDADFEMVEKRRKLKNESIRNSLQAGKKVYGIRHFSPSMYLQYELTRFKLEFTVYREARIGSYVCEKIAEEEKRSFYDHNRDLFTRYFGDSFAYEEVEMIIEKRLKEMEYERLVQNLLCKFS